MATLESVTPKYERPNSERLSAAIESLAAVERYFLPGSIVDARLFVRALLARKHATDEAMWAVYDQIEAGRYKAIGYMEADELRQEKERGCFPVFQLPAGCEHASGDLFIKGAQLDWHNLHLKLPDSGHGKPHGTASLPIVHSDARSASIEWKGVKYPVSHDWADAFQKMADAKGQPVAIGNVIRKPGHAMKSLPPQLAAIVVRADGNKGYRLAISG